MPEEYIACFSCGAKSLNIEGNCHNYMLASPACYEMFCEVLAQEYSNFMYSKAHHYTVDAYALQHPGKPTNPQAINSVGTHLISLYFLFEKGYELSKAASIKMEFAQFNKSNNIIKSLKRPKKFEGLTIYDIWDNTDPEKHFALCKEWALSTWQAWAEHHKTIEQWASYLLDSQN